MMYGLPTSLEVNGTEYRIRTDYRAVLDICAALSDPTMKDWEKAVAMLLLYEDYESIPKSDIEEALQKAAWFINCGDSAPGRPVPKLMDWEKDFKWIVAPINRIAGTEIRALEYLHWWTFISYYYEIGDCFFAQIVNIRNKKARGKKLEKYEREFYNANRDAIDLREEITDTDKEFIKRILEG